jgi:hypothetical protein
MGNFNRMINIFFILYKDYSYYIIFIIIMDENKELLENLSKSQLPELPDWQKNLWIGLIYKNAKESWPHENIIKEYIFLRDEHYKLKKKYDDIKESGMKYIKLEENLLSLKSEINLLKHENESLKSENIEKTSSYNKIKAENNNLLNSMLKSKKLEAELQNKIFDLELKLKK